MNMRIYTTFIKIGYLSDLYIHIYVYIYNIHTAVSYSCAANTLNHEISQLNSNAS